MFEGWSDQWISEKFHVDRPAKWMNDNITARYFTRRDIALISEMESKVVSVVVQWAVDGDVKWTRLWRYRSGDCHKTLLTMICHIPLPLKPFLPQVNSEIFSFQGYSLNSQAHWNTSLCIWKPVSWTTATSKCFKVLSYCSKYLLCLDNGNVPIRSIRKTNVSLWIICTILRVKERLVIYTCYVHPLRLI